MEEASGKQYVELWARYGEWRVRVCACVCGRAAAARWHQRKHVLFKTDKQIPNAQQLSRKLDTCHSRTYYLQYTAVSGAGCTVHEPMRIGYVIEKMDGKTVKFYSLFSVER